MWKRYNFAHWIIFQFIDLISAGHPFFQSCPSSAVIKRWIDHPGGPPLLPYLETETVTFSMKCLICFCSPRPAWICSRCVPTRHHQEFVPCFQKRQNRGVVWFRPKIIESTPQCRHSWRRIHDECVACFVVRVLLELLMCVGVQSWCWRV